MTETWCFWCLTEMCTHKRAEGAKSAHPDRNNQVKAVTSYQGTPCCAVCALEIGKTLGLVMARSSQIPASVSIPVVPSSLLLPVRPG